LYGFISLFRIISCTLCSHGLILTMKSLSVVSWHHQTPERRHLKRTRLGPPDVYPQDAKQEEDNLGADRLKKGYQVAVTSYEHESVVWNAKVPRLDRLEDTMIRGAQIVMQVLSKKFDLNANLDKERKRTTKDGVFQNFSHTVRQADKSKERKEWFTDLARGKSLASLARRPPFFRKKEDALEYLCDFKVPVARALWFLKLVAVGQGIASNVNKQKKSTNDQLASEHASLFTKYIKVMLSQMSDSAKLDTNIVYTERWPHFVCICKHAYEDGMIERQEFLMDMCDIFADRFVQRSDKPHFLTLFRLFLTLFSQYTDQITQNLLLSRRCAFLVARRLALNKKQLEESLGRPVNVAEIFEDMTQCQNQRAIILILCGLLHAILIDCPGALIWNNFQVAEGRPPPLLHHLCGSPLDLLPCAVEALPMPPGHGSDKIQELVQLRVLEVKRRSRAVENRWSLNQTQKAGFALTVRTCLEILGALDAARHDQPRCIEKIYNLIFNGSQKEKFEHEHAIRIKMLLHWAVTVEREGTHRALIVASVLSLRVNHRKGFKFGERHLQDILLEYLDTEGPQLGNPYFHEEFASLMHLFMELQSAGVFSHDSYVKGLITTGEMSEQLPIMTLVKNREEQEMRQRNGMCVQPVDVFGNVRMANAKEEKRSMPTLASMPPDPVDEHPLMGAEVSPHERFLIHLPVPQTNEYRSECNQRALLLYGIGEQRDTVKNELKKAAREITKIWTKRIVVEFSFSKPSEIRFKKRASRDQINEALQKFKSQTYYDQVVLCGWCCDNFISMITDFVDGHSAVLPAAEGFDVLLNMMEHCKNISGIMELAEELLPLLASVEQVLAERRVDCVPSTVSTHLGYVLVAYISHNYYYFLHFENAPEIINGFYRLIEKQLSPDSCLTGWGRSIGIFVLNAKKQLIEAELTRRKMDGRRELLKRLLPPWKFSNALSSAKYNAHLFKEFLDEPKRIFSFNDYRRLNALINDDEARYSFVVSALTAARQCGNDYDKLVELANICGHVSAQASISAEWCGALQALCCSSVAGNHGFTDLFLVINVEDSKCHYSIATFYMLLASRNCFSMNALFHQLLQSALSSLLKSDSSKTDVDAEAGVCLALLVLADMICQSDEPIVLSPIYTGEREPRKCVSGMADKWALSAGHLHDIGEAIFELLFTICIIADYTKNKLRDRIDDKNDHNFRREYISQISKAVLMAMCEQDWVTQRVYRVCEQTNMDVFNSHRLKKNCLGQQLLRMALRRKCERSIVQELTVCNGNSKKSLIDKLFAVLSIWNIRATYFDLKLMIKEISPEGSSSKHAQQGAIAADALIGEIGKCCRDLFTSSHKSEKKLPDAATGKAFRLKHITNYWLISPLVRLCPKPGNLPASFPAVTVQAKFLKEAASMLDTANDSSKERIQQSAWLLSQEPFLNLVLTCLKGEEQQRDGLVGSLLKQLQDLATKTKDNPTLPYLRKFSLEREGLLLRLSLVGGMFDSVCHPSNCDAWALLFFQLMLYGVVSRERDRFLFESCFDMLSTLLVWSITDPMNAVPVNSQDPDTKYRFANYSVIVKKLRKELNERALIPELRCLMQFLPIPKPAFELITCEPYGTVPMSPQKLSKGQIGSSPVKATKQGLQFGEKVKISAYDMVQNFNSESSMKRTWTWAMFQAVKLDRSPVPIQKHIQRLIQHAHYNEFVRPTICGMDRPPNLDIYLSPPTMDVSEAPVSVHHVSSSTTATTTTSTSTAATIAGQMSVSQAPSGEPIIFPGQVGSLQQLPDMTRAQASTSPRGTRGGRRKSAAGPSSRSQGTTRKKQQRQTADQIAPPSSTPQMGPQSLAPPGSATASAYGWAPQPTPQPPQMQQFPPSAQPGGMNQTEDSKMKIHSMILQKRQAQAASGTSSQSFQGMASASGGQYGQMMMKMESASMSMDQQQSYSSAAAQMSMSQDQGPQFGAQQRNYNSQQPQTSTGSVFDTRMMGHQQQQMQFNQQQYQQQY
uniref:Mediator complex subunit Med12 domain-containing protein n=2 Tax=Parascaris univalens TaxID=6257 RepID=A0A915CBV2_PARUN